MRGVVAQPPRPMVADGLFCSTMLCAAAGLMAVAGQPGRMGWTATDIAEMEQGLCRSWGDDCPCPAEPLSNGSPCPMQGCMWVAAKMHHYMLQTTSYHGSQHPLLLSTSAKAWSAACGSWPDDSELMCERICQAKPEASIKHSDCDSQAGQHEGMANDVLYLCSCT